MREALEVCPYITSAQASVEGLEGSSLHIRVVMRTVYGDGTLEV